jgi:two-component system, chemotaxis family, protein-glutamate methylesterase/glutaminase
MSQSSDAPHRAPGDPIRVLVVDDSAYMRFTISKGLNEAGGMVVVGTAHDGKEALELIPRLQPDVVTLDVEMPRLDGLSTLREIMTRFPRPVVMLSSLTKEGANETIQALTLGAVDFAAKPETRANMGAIMDEVIVKVRGAASAKIRGGFRPGPVVANRPPADRRSPPPAASPASPKLIRARRSQEKVVIVGASTGGPRALNTVFQDWPVNLPAAVLIVQHMPAGFTRSLAERLNSLSPLAIKEAEPGDVLEVGRGLLAPGGFHMIIDENDQVVLNQNPPVQGVRPAVDVTMASLAQRYGANTIAVVLTGMGHDGTTGATLIRQAGGRVIAEAESTSVVWGMPRSIIEAGLANEVVPLGDVAAAVKKFVTND